MNLPPSRARARLANEKQTNWLKIIIDLNRLGWSNEIIANELGTGRTTVINWRDGAEPKYFDGKRLLDLWALVTGKGISDRPQLERGDFRGNHSYANKRK